MHEKIGLVIGVVGPSGGGKSTLVRALQGHLIDSGHVACTTNAGDYYRRQATKTQTLETILGSPNRLEEDRKLDKWVIELISRSMGISAWLNISDQTPPNILIISGRVTSLLADKLKSEKAISEDAYFGIGVACDANEIARRQVSKHLREGGYSRQQLLSMDRYELNKLEQERIRLRDTGDLHSFHELYAISALSQLSGLEYNNVAFDTSKMSIQQELEEAIRMLRLFGLKTI